MEHLNIEESRFCNRIILMNKFYIYFFLFFLSFSNFSYATKVYLTDFESQADYKIFTVSSPSQADCKVYMVSQESRAQRGTGKWYKVDQPSRADVKIANDLEEKLARINPSPSLNTTSTRPVANAGSARSASIVASPLRRCGIPRESASIKFPSWRSRCFLGSLQPYMWSSRRLNRISALLWRRDRYTRKTMI